jgi:hypothetical protein
MTLEEFLAQEGAQAEFDKAFNDKLKGLTFDDLLKHGHQSEFDKRMNKGLTTAKQKWEEDKNLEIENAKTEAEKLAKMNAQQKAEYESKQREEALAKREAELNKRELIATAKSTLVEKGLDASLVDLLDYSSAENCNKSISKIEETFGAALNKAVAEKVKGKSDPFKKADDSKSSFTIEDIKKMSPEEINKNWAEIQKILNK